MKPWKQLAFRTSHLSLFFMLILGAGQATAACYDLSNMNPGDSFTPADPPIPFAEGSIQVQYLRNQYGNPTAFNTVLVANSQIAGPQPELHVRNARLFVSLNVPASRVTLDVANNSGGSQLVNIGSNGERVEYLNGIEGVNGLVLADNSLGRVEVQTSLNPTGSGNWSTGTFALVARTGGINAFTLGALTMNLDNLCIYP